MSIVSPDLIHRFAQDFRNDPHNKIMQRAIIRSGIRDVAINNQPVIEMQYTFSHEIETGKITAQKASGRCWLFAGLNTLRLAVMRKLNLDTFEFSQNYSMFWDKLEKANYFLESILDTVEEEVDSRLVMWLLGAPVNDGGQWDMFVNLLEKYGAVPKHVMPETYQSSNTGVMNYVLTVKLREDAARLREGFRLGRSMDALRAMKEEMLGEIYRILCRCLGEPPQRFDFEYRDKDKNFYRDANLTPQEFLHKYVDVKLDDYVSIINAPTADKPYGKTYTVQYLGNVKGGRDVLYLNVDIQTLKAAALAQLMDNEPVWFGCDVGKMMDRDTGIMDLRMFDYSGALDVQFGLNKAERLDYRESAMTHAMVFTGVNVVDGKPVRWKVENSWGTDPGNQGFFIMSDAWFDEYLYQVVVNKKYLSAELQVALEQKPIELKPWDPMGSLASE